MNTWLLALTIYLAATTAATLLGCALGQAAKWGDWQLRELGQEPRARRAPRPRDAGERRSGSDSARESSRPMFVEGHRVTAVDGRQVGQ